MRERERIWAAFELKNAIQCGFGAAGLFREREIFAGLGRDDVEEKCRRCVLCRKERKKEIRRRWMIEGNASERGEGEGRRRKNRLM